MKVRLFQKQSVPIARDEDGNVLSISPQMDAPDRLLELAGPDGVGWGAAIVLVDFEGALPEIMNVSFGELTLMPVDWLLWIIYGLYDRNPLEGPPVSSRLRILAPVPLADETWTDLLTDWANSDTVSLSQDLVKDPSDDVAGEQLAQEIDGLLERISGPTGRGPLGALSAKLSRYRTDDSVIGEWTLEAGDLTVNLDVRLSSRGIRSCITYSLEWQKPRLESPTPGIPSWSGGTTVGLTRDSLVDVLQGSGLWMEESDFRTWLTDKLATKTWLIDRSKFQMFTMLGLRSPLFGPVGELEAFLEAEP